MAMYIYVKCPKLCVSFLCIRLNYINGLYLARPVVCVLLREIILNATVGSSLSTSMLTKCEQLYISMGTVPGLIPTDMDYTSVFFYRSLVTWFTQCSPLYRFSDRLWPKVLFTLSIDERECSFAPISAPVSCMLTV